MRWRTTTPTTHVVTGVSANKKSSNWWGRQNAAPLTFDPMPSQMDFGRFFSNLDKYRLKFAGCVISGEAIDEVGMDNPCTMWSL